MHLEPNPFANSGPGGTVPAVRAGSPLIRANTVVWADRIAPDRALLRAYDLTTDQVTTLLDAPISAGESLAPAALVGNRAVVYVWSRSLLGPTATLFLLPLLGGR